MLSFQPSNSQSLALLESSEILSILGDPDLELELLTPTCLDQCATPTFSFLSPVSSPSSPTVDPVPPIEQLNPQARLLNNSPPASPTISVFINNSIPFPTVDLESEDEPLRPTDISRGNIRPVASRPRHANSQNDAKNVALYKQHRRDYFAARARIVKKTRFNRRLPYQLKPETFLGKSYVGMVPDKNLQLRRTLFHLNELLYI